ncbi:MAG: deoxyribose-phosphate aldolase [Thermoanaerobaculia bacterium]|nr:deoxyribose-phosphate aldolase [Thermoanaerobaculia bacterium]
MSRLRIALAADHGGFELKERLKEHLSAAGHDVADLGTSGKEPVDYPVFARAAALLVARGEADFGVVVDGAGIGSAMAANKVPGVLAATCNTEALAKNAREHNDARLLALGAGHVDEAGAKRIVDVFLSTACTAERHLKRVAMIRDMEKERGMAELSAEDIERIAAKVKEMLGKGGAAPSAAPALTPEQVARLIDHTLLKPDAMASDVEKLCAEARQHGFFSVCVNPVFVPQVKKLLQGSPVKLCCVVGFPLGAQDPQIKLLEARKAIREGAQEVDMVINVGALKGKDDALVLRDIRGVVEACKDGRALSKVILETALLTDEEKVRACELSMKAGADYVKTSTGFSSGGATAEDIALMARTVAPKKLGVKASGGVRTYADLLKMVKAGATRVGASSSVKILEEARAAAGK